MSKATNSGVGTWDNDYAYIQVFIEFLKEIIDIIKDLFSGISSSDDDKSDDAAAEA